MALVTLLKEYWMFPYNEIVDITITIYALYIMGSSSITTYLIVTSC